MSERGLYRRVSRRTLLGGGAAVGATAVVYMLIGDKLWNEPKDSNFIHTSSGVLIPTSANSEFSDNGYSLQELASARPAELSYGELSAINRGLDLVPGAKYLSKVLVPYRSPEASAGRRIDWTSGQYIGRSRDPKLYKEVPQVRLDLPNGFGINDKGGIVPVYAGKTMYERPSSDDELPQPTIGEGITRVVIHEYGHAFDDAVFFEARSKEDYMREAGNDSDVFANLSAFNPLYQSFARVNGWKLAPLEELDVYPRDVLEKSRREKLWPFGSPGAWIRDTEVWGEGVTYDLPWFIPPRVRLTVYATINHIDETFAEFFMASFLYPEFLTRDERAYFDKIKIGLKENPRAFIKEVAHNPEVLF